MIGRIIFFIMLYAVVLAAMSGTVCIMSKSVETWSSTILILLLAGAYWGMFRRHTKVF